MEAGMDKSRQERILQAAEEVFSRRGYIEATLDEIIKVADTGKGTVYKYFGNKENLFYTLVESKHNILMQEFWKIAQSTADVESKIHAYLEIWTRFLMTNTVLWQVMMFEMTGGNRGFTAVVDDNGTIKIKAQWGAQPTKAQSASMERYFHLLKAETSAFEYIFLEAQSKNFFKQGINPIDASRNLMFSVAMVVFHWKGAEGRDVDACCQHLHEMVHYMLYGIVRNQEPKVSTKPQLNK
jgi:AcrR family transcriptional regulator